MNHSTVVVDQPAAQLPEGLRRLTDGTRPLAANETFISTDADFSPFHLVVMVLAMAFILAVGSVTVRALTEAALGRTVSPANLYGGVIVTVLSAVLTVWSISVFRRNRRERRLVKSGQLRIGVILSSDGLLYNELKTFSFFPWACVQSVEHRDNGPKADMRYETWIVYRDEKGEEWRYDLPYDPMLPSLISRWLQPALRDHTG